MVDPSTFDDVHRISKLYMYIVFWVYFYFFQVGDIV
jgi:hypothetical protein